MKKKFCWALKIKYGKFVNQPILHNYWEADRTMLFRTKKFAQEWLDRDPFWKGRAEVVKVMMTVKETGE